jgi:hypothetical protein
MNKKIIKKENLIKLIILSDLYLKNEIIIIKKKQSPIRLDKIVTRPAFIDFQF